MDGAKLAYAIFLVNKDEHTFMSLKLEASEIVGYYFYGNKIMAHIFSLAYFEITF